VSRIVQEYNEKSIELQRNGVPRFIYDEGKIAELATGAHIFYERSPHKSRIIPTEKQQERKEHVRSVTEAEKATKPKKAPDSGANKSGGWRDVVHPSNGTRLGDVSPEKIKSKLAPWYYRTEGDTTNNELHRAIGEAIRELGFTYTELLEAYINDYATEFAPDTERQYIALIRDFGSYWVNFVEDDSKDE
jgi:hypothetical protein